MPWLQRLLDQYAPNNKILWGHIYDFAEIDRGRRVVRKELLDDGQYVVYQNSLTPLGKIDEWNYGGEMPFVIGAGAAGEIGYSYEPFWAADDCYPLRCSTFINSRYLYHLLMSQQSIINSRVRRGSIPRISRDSIGSIVVAVPPMEVQMIVVSVLDNLLGLCTDISSGLPAEIQARHKQYEYYRDKLLEFEPVA